MNPEPYKHLPASLLICVMAVGCTGSEPDADLTLVAELGYTDSYSTESGLLTRVMCSEPDYTIAVTLPEESLRSIASVAERTGFYALPHDLTLSTTGLDEDSEVIVITSHCPAWSLSLATREQQNAVSWSCRYAPDEVAPAEVHELTNTVTSFLQPWLDQFPASDCRYR